MARDSRFFLGGSTSYAAAEDTVERSTIEGPLSFLKPNMLSRPPVDTEDLLLFFFVTVLRP